jgi:hypothetical protein
MISRMNVFFVSREFGGLYLLSSRLVRYAIKCIEMINHFSLEKSFFLFNKLEKKCDFFTVIDV